MFTAMYTFSVTEESLSNNIMCQWGENPRICGVPFAKEAKDMVLQEIVSTNDGLNMQEYTLKFSNLFFHQGYLYPAAPPDGSTPLLLLVEVPPGEGGKLVFTTRMNGINIPLINNTRVRLLASEDTDGMWSYLFILFPSSILQIERTGTLKGGEYRHLGVKWRGKDSPLGAVSFKRWDVIPSMRDVTA